MKKPNLFIVGEPKCGTTSLHEMLSLHPDIFMSEPKELGYFLTDMPGSVRTEEQFLSFFAKVKDQKYLGESTPTYLLSKKAAEEICRFNPDAKIIMSFRNPPEYLYSLHSQMVFNLLEEEPDFNKALKKSRPAKKLRHRIILDYDERLRFFDHAKRYFDLFPMKNIFVMVFEEYRDDPIKVCKSIFDFLGIDSSFEPKKLQSNPNKIIRYKGIKALTDRLNARKIRIMLPRPIYDAVAGVYRRTIFVEKERAPLDNSTRDAIIKKTREQVRKLSKLTGKDFVGYWNYQ